MTEFIDEPIGVIVSMEASEQGGMMYHVWFPYSRIYINTVREGTFVAVRNFSSTPEKKAYSILELVSVLPVHYALGSSPAATDRAFPGFVVEAAKSARVDWEQEKPVEQTTKIKADSIPTGLQLSFEGDGPPKMESDMSLPMIGEDVHLLTDELTSAVINRGLTSKEIITIAPAQMVLNRKISVLLSVEELLRTHFGIFGFTGAGKSNLLSTLISELIGLRRDIKVVLFDLMSEYSALLLDVLDTLENGVILALGEESVPGGDATLDYLKGKLNRLDDSAASIVRTLLLPRELIPFRSLFQVTIKNLLKANKIKIFNPSAAGLLSAEVRVEADSYVKGNIGNTEPSIRTWIELRLPETTVLIGLAQLRTMATEARDFVKNGIPNFQAMDTSQAPLAGGASFSGERMKLSPTGNGVMLSIAKYLESVSKPTDIPKSATLDVLQLRNLLDDEGKSALVLVQSNKDDELRNRSAQLVNIIFDGRRRAGRIVPQTLFVYDEADEFIPSGQPSDDSYLRSRAAATTLARRGRKFGMGIAIATQRVAYLDTSILAQPHSYMISKLPRLYDRQTVSNAFGLSEEMLQRTLKFTKGQWLLVSYDATGLENVPLPVQFPNRNQRVLTYLKGRQN